MVLLLGETEVDWFEFWADRVEGVEDGAAEHRPEAEDRPLADERREHAGPQAVRSAPQRQASRFGQGGLVDT